METNQNVEAVAAQVEALPLEVVQHVLWHAGDLNLGVSGGTFVETLLVLISRADQENRLKLSLVFEDYVNGWRASRHGWSHEMLRDRVKAAEARSQSAQALGAALSEAGL